MLAKPRLNIGHVIIGLAAVLLLAIMFGPQQQSDAVVNQQQGTIQRLNHLQQLYNRFDQNTLEVRLLLQPDVSSLHSLLGQAEKELSSLGQQESAWLNDEKLAILQGGLKTKQAWLLAFESNWQNFQRNITQLEQQFLSMNSMPHGTAKGDVYTLLNQTLRVYQGRDEENVARLLQQLDVLLLKQAATKQQIIRQKTLLSMKVLLQASRADKVMMKQFFASSKHNVVASLLAELEKIKLDGAIHLQSNRYSLAMLALLLLTYIAFIIIRLRSASTHLENSMQDLEHLKFALDQHAIVTMTNPQGVLTYANDNLCKISRYKHDELIGSSHQVLNSGFHDGAFFSTMWKTINNGEVWHGEIQNKKKNSHIYWVDSTIVPFVNKQGILERFIAISSDITTRKQAEIALKEREKHIRNVLDTALDSVLILDEMGNASYWNPLAERTFGWSAKEIIGSPILDNLFPPEHLRHFQNQSFNSLLKDRVELVAIHKDGHQFPVEVAISQLDSGGDFHFSAFIRDISRRKQAEQDIKVAHDQALESSRLKSTFLSTVSHEIRTPMNGIIGMTDLILDTTLDEEQHEFAETIRSSAEALLCIINDILDFSKIEAGKMSVEPIPFSISSVVGGVVDTLRVKAKDKGVPLLYRLDSDLPDSLLGDPGRLRQILLNITDNALKFTKEGKVVIKVLQQTVTSGVPLVYFEVSDTGIGLSEQGQEKLFQPFSQADGSTTRKYGGTGLGLSICARLVKLMKGEIAVKSELGQGSVFYFSIPLPLATQQMESDKVLELPQSAHDAKVLLVEDNAVNQRVASLHLKKLGITPDISSNGQQALDAIKENAYDIIFMDCQMPVMDGFAATEHIRQWEAANGMSRQPIIAMTANAMKGDREQCLVAGMDDYLSKPIRAVDLDLMLQHWLQAQGSDNRNVDAALVDSEAVPLIDLSWLEEMFGDDQATIHELLGMFLESAETIVLKMTQCEDSGKMKDLAHEMKGAAANLGVTSIVLTAKYMEDHPDLEHDGHIKLLQQHIANLKQFVGTIVASV